jgi:hypothetical protein
MLPTKPIVDSPKDKLNPKINHMTLSIAKPKKICMKIEAAFFFLSNPDSNRPNAGIISSTRLPATSIHAVSPESSTIERIFNLKLITITKFDYQMIII